MVAPFVTHRALDGATYRMEGDLDLHAPCTSAVEVVVGGRLVEFTAGPASLGTDVAASLGIDAPDSELTFQKGTLRIHHSVEREPRSGLVERPSLVVWRGERHALVTRLYGMTEAEVLGLLRSVRIAETEYGVTLQPDPSTGSAFARPATVIKEVPGLGLLELSRRTKEHTAQLPPWKGVSVASGELFRDTLFDGSPFFVLSSPEIWATLVPLASTSVERVPELVGRLALRRTG
ncbi:hypothetical protein [Streptomyces chromofuscus]|uniref:Uncharacterized protein n=1 Tax=Streptomyces chromofuscus TaxID=42881 RepID=A0A7M2T7Y8_STRCW|nr:hypothetical protein [Streptomyces chromofuscus]QOV44836.1 hypothetical protein IPT68_02120 [Streptomyces chromofuscus]GGT33547.1 hypothetical protein GCM10010254_62440 [Streptomyces chromofuscus]